MRAYYVRPDQPRGDTTGDMQQRVGHPRLMLCATNTRSAREGRAEHLVISVLADLRPETLHYADLVAADGPHRQRDALPPIVALLGHHTSGTTATASASMCSASPRLSGETEAMRNP
jgi:hypothetical protein